MNDFKLEDLDLSVDPRDDFYHYANGGWLNSNSLPKDQARWGPLEEITVNNFEKLYKLASEAALSLDAPKGSAEQIVGDYFHTAMDEKTIELKSDAIIQPYLDQISSIKSTEDILQTIVNLHKIGVTALFKLSVVQDPEDSSSFIAHLLHRGLGLIQREYYLEEAYKEVLDQYQVFLKKIFKELGENQSQGAADVIEVETLIAKIALPRSFRDPRKVNVKTYRNEFITDYLFDWSAYFRLLNRAVPSQAVVDAPDFFSALGSLFESLPISKWKPFFKWHLIRYLEPALSQKFASPISQFYSYVVQGQTQIKERSKQVIDAMNRDIGFPVGKLYIQKHFSSEAKREVFDIACDIVKAYSKKIQALSWMSEITKKMAQKKLAKINIKVGYPESWPEYSSLEVTKDCYTTNLINVKRFHFLEDLNKIGSKKDSQEWTMAPQRANACYRRENNDILIPAGILQFPFFDRALESTSNYASIGMVIAHEITHAFDAEGRHYDENGNLNNWWFEEDSKRFDEISEAIDSQYFKYTLYGKLVNGFLTRSENIADLGALTVSYEAFKKTPSFLNGKVINGLTPSQRFFLAFARCFRSHSTKERAYHDLIDDHRAPRKYRVNGPLSNFEEFYKAFGVKKGFKMYLPEKNRANFWN